METSLIIKPIVLIINAVGIWLAALVNIRKPKGRIAFLFTVMVLLMFMWVDFAYLSRISPPVYSLLLIKSAWAITPFFFVTIYLFIKEFLEKKVRYLLLEKTILIIGIINIPIIFFTPFVIESIGFDNHGILKIIYGKGKWIFFGEVFLLTILGICTLLKKYAIASSIEEKIKIKYLLIGFSFLFLMNAIFNIICPVFFKVFHLYEFGDYSTIVFVSIVAYAVIKRNLFDVKVALTSTLVSIIAILLTLDVFAFTSDLTLRLYKSLVLILFIYFGYLLIKSVLKEIKYREEIKRAYNLEKKAHQELERLDKAKTQFMLATQHHLRTPLTAMIGYLDLIFGGTYGEIQPKIKKALLKFRASTEKLNKVVDELLDVSKFQLGKEFLLIKPNIDLKKILQDIIKELKFEVQVKGIYLKLQSPKNLPLIKADSSKLKVALTNIIDNAVKYTSKGGVIVKTETTDSKILISVKDTGMGIPKEDQKDLFNKTFERGKRAKQANVTGKGIGLYITYHIIKAHHGRIWVESEGKDKGSTFFIELPIG